MAGGMGTDELPSMTVVYECPLTPAADISRQRRVSMRGGG
jgi:hypothetical protein